MCLSADGDGLGGEGLSLCGVRDRCRVWEVDLRGGVPWGVETSHTLSGPRCRVLRA